MSELIKETLSPIVVPVVQQLETLDGIVAETSYLDVVEFNTVPPSSMSIDNQIKAGVKPQSIPPLISSRLSSYEQAVASISSLSVDDPTPTPETTPVNEPSTVTISQPSTPTNNE